MARGRWKCGELRGMKRMRHYIKRRRRRMTGEWGVRRRLGRGGASAMTKTDGGRREEEETEREMFCCLHQQMPESPAAHAEHRARLAQSTAR